MGVGETEVVADDAVPGVELFGFASVEASPQGFELVDEAVYDAEQDMDGGVEAAVEVVLAGLVDQVQSAAHGGQIPQREKHERQAFGVVVVLDQQLLGLVRVPARGVQDGSDCREG